MLLEGVEIGASGIAKIAAGGLSFFVRLDFWESLEHEPARIAAGSDLDDEEAIDLVLSAKATEAEARGASLLARQEQPRFLLRAKLIDRGYPDRAVALALDRLESEGFLSDRRYALVWLRSRIGKALRGRGGRAEGPSTLLGSLRARSLSEEDAKAALAAVLDTETRRSLLAAAAGRLGIEGESAFHELRGLGFTGEEIREFREVRE